MLASGACVLQGSRPAVKDDVKKANALMKKPLRISAVVWGSRAAANVADAKLLSKLSGDLTGLLGQTGSTTVIVLYSQTPNLLDNLSLDLLGGTGLQNLTSFPGQELIRDS